ncbi:tetratricopeptide repeat protein [Anabaena cylindrica UHCC 0172]|uniref:tetratricopeptide repeat protein n=1 Tax=Anabaena cylindrica TaxID=1165 RepID=UPI002B1F7E2D|nr:tetratricopeptide repeat protein [Anabaena cylindrica]MEA5553067.1 tetratricopeptide repeat protein [Anabaena cylindrica UHCC 0172]
MLNSIYAYGYASLAYILYNSGDYQGAIENYSQAILLNSEDSTSYLSRGVARSLIKDYQNAIEDFNQAIRLSPQYAQAYAERGIARAAIGENQTALEDCHRAIQLDPRYVRAYFGRGAAHFYSGNYQGALEDFSLITRMERSAISYYNLGILQYSQGINSQVIKHLTKALDIDPNLTSAYYVRGNACYDVGDEQGAFADFAEAKHIESVGADKIYFEDEFALYARGLAHHRLGNRENAIADLQESAQIALKHQNTIFHQKVINFMSEIQS